MSKPSRPRSLKETEARAILRTIRISPRKLNVVAELIRGKAAQTALAELTFSKRRIAGTVKKVLQAAIANAENNHQLDVDRLVVAEAHVGKSIQMRRFHARGRGRSASIVKPYSHLTVIVRERVAEAKAKAEKPAKAA
ncbi:MAG: 50S ribosomal protein L22 [Alphaproteobacteria bacterium]|jgi:large subunit ribosomal protein L22|nr:50S ribosomal protein L22 [Alphaproteobacteria bacterium]MCA0448756.1 50S ribosomal protein L22 [Pseudomonadota bacterium]